jgi:hypothetical protein
VSQLDFPDSGLDLVTLVLADFANVREGLLNVVSGGITRIQQHGGFPSQIDAHLAMVVYVQPHRVGEQHMCRVVLRYPDTSQEIARVEVGFHVDAQLNPGEGLNVPIVLPLRGIGFEHPGQVDLSVNLNNQPAGLLNFWLSEATTN